MLSVHIVSFVTTISSLGPLRYVSAVSHHLPLSSLQRYGDIICYRNMDRSFSFEANQCEHKSARRLASPFVADPQVLGMVPSVLASAIVFVSGFRSSASTLFFLVPRS